MAKVKFIEVGRNKLTWEEEIATPYEEALERAVKRRGALMSRDITCDGGIVFAGFHSVGRYEIDAPAPAGKEAP